MGSKVKGKYVYISCLNYWLFPYCNSITFWNTIMMSQWGPLLILEWGQDYLHVGLGHEEVYFVKEHSGFRNKYSEDDIIKMIEFLVDNIVVVFAGKVFQQIQ